MPSDASPITGDFRDDSACSECGGECCTIYRDADDPRFSPDSGGGRNPYVDFDEYVLDWYQNFLDAGLVVDTAGAPVGWWGSFEPAPGSPEQLFSPYRLFIVGNDAERAAYRATLPAWVDTEMCQYCHPETGCVIPRSGRPGVCTEYRCERLGR